jgi:hypothetical protein
MTYIPQYFGDLSAVVDLFADSPTVLGVPKAAPGGVDAPFPPQSAAGGSQETLEALVAENAQLRADLASAQQARDTAQAQSTHYRTYYTRTGW